MATEEKTYLIGAHGFVAYLPVDGTLNDARHQLGNVFVIFFFIWYLFRCTNRKVHELKTQKTGVFFFFFLTKMLGKYTVQQVYY